MANTEKVSEYYETKQKLIALMETLRAKDSRGYGMALSIIDHLAESGEAIYLSHDGKWSGRLDMMGWEIASGDNDLDSVLNSVASIIDDDAPKIDNYDNEDIQKEIEGYREAQRQYLEETGDRILGILLTGMNTAFDRYPV